MPNQEQIDYKDTRDNAELANYIAYAEEPYRIGAESAASFGQAAVESSLKSQQAEASQEARKDYDRDQQIINNTNLPQENKNREDRESDINDRDREQIRGWIKDGYIAVHTWLGRDTTPGKRTPGADRFMTVRSDKTWHGYSWYTEGRTMTGKSIQQAFTRRGVPELLTVYKIPEIKFSKINPESHAKDDDVVMLQYETVYERPFSFSGFAKEGFKMAVTANFIRTQLFLPHAQAETALAMIKDKPQLVRELANLFMTEDVEARDSWDRAQPNYSKFQELNGGVNRIAVRRSKNERPEDSEIIEF